ncbi:hypothetical protein Lal_00014547 [Lupinus albus]|nr:hypothetical protein Lal_00014547 [Lupinus albus]
MTGDKSKFPELSLKEIGYVTYGDNNEGKILRIRKIVNASQVVVDTYITETKKDRGSKNQLRQLQRGITWSNNIKVLQTIHQLKSTISTYANDTHNHYNIS